MAIYAKHSGEGDFATCPAGYHQSVCIDVVDLGNQETQWGQKHFVSFGFQVEGVDQDGRRFQVWQRFNLSLHPEASLRKFLERWRGRKYSKEEANSGVDLEKMVGVNATLQVSHNETERGVFANIDSVGPPMDGNWKRIKTIDYVRKIDRDDYQSPEQYTQSQKQQSPSPQQQPQPKPAMTASSAKPKKEDPAPYLGEDDDGLPF